MKTINMIKKSVFASAVIVLSSCASISKAPDHLDQQAKEFISSPNYSQVYVYRNETFGGAISMPVTVDGELAGTTGPNSYFLFTLEPGDHTFTSQGDKSVLKTKTEKGMQYFIWQEVKMGAFSAGSELQLVDESQGRNGVLESTLIDSSIGKQP